MECPGSGHANPGKAGRGRQGRLCRERVGGLLSGPGPGVSRQEVRGPASGTPARWMGVLTSRAQHLEQLEVLHAHLLLVPGQVGCGHRG